MSGPHVLILGAGIGGLALAQTLRKRGVSCEVFERDENLHARAQGWAIAIHSMWAEFWDCMPGDMPEFDSVDHLYPLTTAPELCLYLGGKKVGVRSTDDHKVVRANRSRFREWLSSKIKIHWNKHLTKIEEDDNEVRLSFADGTTARGDVLVGADGVRSFVRGHILNDPTHTNLHTVATSLVGELWITKEQYERQFKLAHSAYIVPCGDAIIFCALNTIAEDLSKAKYYWLMIWRESGTPESQAWAQSASKKELYDFVHKKMAGSDPQLEILDLTKPEDVSSPPLIIRDMLVKELPNSRITLVGDAAHPMTPFRGEGGVHAIRDAFNLGREIGALKQKDKASILAALKTYQTEMLERGSKAVEASRQVPNPKSQQAVYIWGRDAWPMER